VQATLLTAFFSIFASLVRVLGGMFSDNAGGEKVTSIALIIILIGSFIQYLSYSINLSIIGLGLMSIGMGLTNASVFKLVPQTSRRTIGASAGWIGGIGALGGFIIPILLAYFVSNLTAGLSGYTKGFLVFVILSLLSLTALQALNYNQGDI
jgi:NNP family nitrate/nitrite transporter-like MFS transporter